MPKEDTAGKRPGIRPWAAFVLNVIPFPVGLGYIYLFRFDFAALSILIRLSTLIIGYGLTVFSSLFVIALIDAEGCFLDDGDCEAIPIYWAINITVNAIGFLIAGVHGFRLARRQNVLGTSE